MAYQELLTKVTPTMVGEIDRRLLLNIRVEPEALSGFVPEPFQLQLVDGQAMAGICLIRFKDLKPKFANNVFGLKQLGGLVSENAAHRIAVTWGKHSKDETGVYISRRDTNSKLASLVGGRLFPGKQYMAKFSTNETEQKYEVEMKSKDGEVSLDVSAEVTDSVSTDSVFKSTDQASEFYRCGSIGYSDKTSKPTDDTNSCTNFDGMELVADNWAVTPLKIKKLESSFFSQLPKDSYEIDNGLLMRDIQTQWNSQPSISNIV